MSLKHVDLISLEETGESFQLIDPVGVVEGSERKRGNLAKLQIFNVVAENTVRA